MKNHSLKSVLTALVITFASLTVSAQGGENHYNTGDNLKLFGVGIGLGSDYGVYSGSSATPLIDVFYEQEVYRFEDLGTLTVGGTLGYKSYSYSDNGYNEHWRYYIIGARSVLHVTAIKVDNLDLYGGLMLNYYALNYTNNFGSHNGLYRTNYNSHIGMNLFLGGRYYFNEKVAAFGELGFGPSILNIGVSFKL
jgi:hypothetical protein